MRCSRKCARNTVFTPLYAKVTMLCANTATIARLITSSARTIGKKRKGGIMGEFGYFYGYSLVFVFLVGGLVGFIVGRWFSK